VDLNNKRGQAMKYERTRKKIRELMQAGVFPGASFSFVSQSESDEDTIWGNASIEPVKEILTSAMLFDVASLTKVICTTTVVLQLADAGELDIDQTLQSYYPAFKDQKITIRHLLTHTADIQSYIKNRDQLSKEELRQAYTMVQSGAALGEKVAYTDTGTILLGFMLEELFQKEVVTIFKEQVLEPLEMKHSCFLPPQPLRTVPTENHPVRGLIRGQTHDPKAFVLAEHAGNAGLFTNVADLKHFVQMYLNQGRYHSKQLLKAKTIQALLTDQTPNGKGQRSLGWDLMNDLQHQPLLFHTGYTGTFLLMDVPNQEAFIFLSNRVHPMDRKDEYLLSRAELIETYLREKNNTLR
jgi:CubicO group peptidase (beta-lactamase class C family)